MLPKLSDCSTVGLPAVGLDGFELSSPSDCISLESPGGPMSAWDTASLVFGAASFAYSVGSEVGSAGIMVDGIVTFSLFRVSCLFWIWSR